MPQELIVIFLLFFAVLAFGWFYWQRAKSRDAGRSTAVATDDAPVQAADAGDAEDVEALTAESAERPQ
jgi:predicted negative regulator of RcsB-dependent stress response